MPLGDLSEAHPLRTVVPKTASLRNGKLPSFPKSPVELYMDTKMMTATEPDWIRSAIEKHRVWIESVRGVSIEKTLILRAS